MSDGSSAILSRQGQPLLRYVLGAVLFVAFASPVVNADSTQLNLTYTVMGTGGLSPAQAGVSDSKFSWVDTSGTVPASTVTSLGFETFPSFMHLVDELGVGGGGSLLMSSDSLSARTRCFRSISTC